MKVKALLFIILMFTIPVFAPTRSGFIYYTCPNCHKTWEFISEDSEYMNSWSKIHYSYCTGNSSAGGSSTDYNSLPVNQDLYDASKRFGEKLFGTPDNSAQKEIERQKAIAKQNALKKWTDDQFKAYDKKINADKEKKMKGIELGGKLQTPGGGELKLKTGTDFFGTGNPSEVKLKPIGIGSDPNVVDLRDIKSGVVDLNVVRGIDVSDVKVTIPTENPAKFRNELLTDYSTTFNERVQGQNDTAQEITKYLEKKELFNPVKNISALEPGDVILVSPNDTISSVINGVDSWASNDPGSPAYHTATYLGERYGKRLYLNNTPGTGPVIMEEKYFLAEYSGKKMDVATLVGEPLSKHEGDELWKGAKELAKSGGYGISALPSTNGKENMVCSEASRWLLLRVGRSVPETKNAVKSVFVKFSPADFYDEEQYFLVHSLGMNK